MAEEKTSASNDKENQSNGIQHDEKLTSEDNKGTKRKADTASTSNPEEPPKKEQKTLEQTLTSDASNANNEDEEKPEKTDSSNEAETTHAKKEDAVQESKERERAEPSNISEKGIIYFFARGRVDVDELDGVQDIARSYIVLRPLPEGAQLTNGVIQDFETNRLLALPKKVFPKSHQDRFMVFVEKAGVTVKQLKEDFMEGSEYSTQTAGVRHTPPVTAVGEGVYAITTGERESHLAYILTIPSTIGEVQESLGINERGSFILSLKNPQSSGPANTNLPEGAKFPKDIMDEFRGRAWMPPTAKHLDYDNAQLLLIGEGIGELEKAVEPSSKDKNKEEKDTPLEHMETLHEEDEKRTKALQEENAIFADLQVRRQDFPDVQTTW